MDEIICPDDTILKGVDASGNAICLPMVDIIPYEKPPPKGDVEAAIDFTWEILFLSPWELIYISIPMTVLATYGLTIYFIFKWIQRKFNV